jgi:hypothetical protein
LFLIADNNQKENRNPMMYWKIIRNVYDAFHGLPVRLAELTGLSPQWHQSHGRPPETFNEHGTGKPIREVEDMLKIVGLWEQAHKGAGVMLIEQLALAVRTQHCSEVPRIDGRELANKICKESTEAFLKVNTDLATKSVAELEEIRDEVRQSHDVHRESLEDLDKYIADRKERREAQSAFSNPLYSPGRAN